MHVQNLNDVPPAGWYRNEADESWWWDGERWGPAAPNTRRSDDSNEDHTSYRWVPMGSLANLANDPIHMKKVISALSSIPSVEFSSDPVPSEGSLVPADCHWAFVAYPGPIPDEARRVSGLNRKFVAMGNLPGRTLTEITSVAGSPSMAFSLPDGMFARGWQSGGLLSVWQIILKFDRYGICVGIENELSL